MTAALFENRDAHLPFDGDQLRDLIERASQIQNLTDHPGWQYLEDYVVATTAAQQRYILAGNCKTQEEYASKTGTVAGMLAVLKAPQTLAAQVDAAKAAAAQIEEDQ